jgi:hypothetical protein
MVHTLSRSEGENGNGQCTREPSDEQDQWRFIRRLHQQAPLGSMFVFRWADAGLKHCQTVCINYCRKVVPHGERFGAIAR